MDESIKILPNFKKFNSYIDDVKQGISTIMLFFIQKNQFV